MKEITAPGCGCVATVDGEFVYGYKQECPVAHLMFTELIEANRLFGPCSDRVEVISGQLNAHILTQGV